MQQTSPNSSTDPLQQKLKSLISSQSITIKDKPYLKHVAPGYPYVFPAFNNSYVLGVRQCCGNMNINCYRHITNQGDILQEYSTTSDQQTMDIADQRLVFLLGQNYFGQQNTKITQWDLVNDEKIVIDFPSMYYYCEMFIFRESKLLCFCYQIWKENPHCPGTKVRATLLASYYRFPLNRDHNSPVKTFNISQQPAWAIYQMNDKSMLGIYLRYSDQTDQCNFMTLSIENEKPRKFKYFPFRNSWLSEIKPGLIFIKGYRQYLLIHQDQEQEFKYLQEVDPDLHRIQFCGSFKNSSFQQLKYVNAPCYYVDPETFQVLGRGDVDDRSRWRWYAPASDGNVEIWARYNWEDRSLMIEEKRVYNRRILISFLLCEFVEKLDEDLLCYVLDLAIEENQV